MNFPPNPADRGPVDFTTVVYAAGGLDYSQDPWLGQYHLYHGPSQGCATRRIDISDFGELGLRRTPEGPERYLKWPFTNSDVPINGIARVPLGNGPFPLVLFAHGNHDPLEHSTLGYLYLCDILASHGILAATIDVNFLNGGNQGENGARAIVHLEHVRQFLIWNGQAGHPLHGKVDGSRIMIVGHSRGGEAVGHASLFNRLDAVQPEPISALVPLDGTQGLGPYHFQIRAAIAIAPTDKLYEPVTGPTALRDSYLILHGSRDGDVSTFDGYQTFDRSHAVDLGNPTQSPEGFKSLLWIHGANHNYFNSVWGQESFRTITRAEQVQIAKVYIAALAQAVLLDRHEYLGLMQSHSIGIQAGWLPAGVRYVSQYQGPRRLYLQHFEEPGVELSPSAPVQGTVATAGVQANKMGFDQGSTSHLYQETNGLRPRWDLKGGSYRIELTPGSFNVDGFEAFSLRVGQSFEPDNAVGRDQDFTLVFADGKTTVPVRASSVGTLIYPATDTASPEIEPRTVMQTLRVPFADLKARGLGPGNLAWIELSLDQTATGILYVDDLQLTI